MESYDPRNPIIKATDDEERAEVHGHIQNDADPTAGKRRLRAHESSDEVQGHNLDDADKNRAKRKLRAPEDELADRIGMATDEAEGDEDDVEGHRLHQM